MRSSSDPGASGLGDRHGWNNLASYLDVHYSHMQTWEYFIEHDGLVVRAIGPRVMRIEGTIRLQHGIRLDVNKILEMDDRRRVRTTSYSYHACWGDDGARPIIRYDNAHEYEREGHLDAHHKHCFNYHTWDEIKPPEHIGYERWPSLSDVIGELETWWDEHGRFM